MFGYLTARQDLLTEEQQKRYRASYCGLCQSLKLRHGNLSRFTLNYDMTFLILLLGSLYEPEERLREAGCIAHPLQTRQMIQTDYSDYAADMNVALAYLKCLDNWTDDSSVSSLTAAQFLKNGYLRAEEKYPTQCAAMQKSIRDLREIEESGREAPDEAGATFGHMMAELFALREDYWTPYLREFGFHLGKGIYLLDAAMDLEEDAKKKWYNPFLSRLGREDNADYFEEILKMTFGDALQVMDRLPLLQDLDLLNNVMCFGLWNAFNQKYRKGTADESGSV